MSFFFFFFHVHVQIGPEDLHANHSKLKELQKNRYSSGVSCGTMLCLE